MKTTNANPAAEIDPIFAELNLDPVGKNLFIGHIDRVPFRMEMVATGMTVGLLFVTRFSKVKEPIREFPDVPDGGRLQALIEEKKAEYTAEDGQVWFNLFAAHELIERGELLTLLREFAGSVKSYIDFDDQPCFACKQNKAMQPVFHSEKIHLICDACHERLNQKAAALTKVDSANVIFSLLWAFVVSILGGIIWSLGWMAFEYIFAGRRLPTIVFTIAFLILGALVALPIAWVFKKIPRRGIALSNAITTGACILTAILGEAFLCGYLFFRELHFVPDPAQLFAIWRELMAESGGFYVIGKIITVGVMWAITTESATPKVSLEEVAAPTSR